MGYVTSVGEDVGDSPYTAGSIYGYRDQKLTYDIYPLFQKVAEWSDKKLRYKYLYSKFRCPCIGSRPMSNLIFEFARSMFKQYSDVPKFLLTVHDEGHDTAGNQVLMLDPELKQYLKHLNDTGSLSHTGVILMADHGLHYGPLFRTNRKQAAFEHGRPFGAFILPKRMVTKQLKENVKRMVNIRDIHMTIRDMASFPHRSTSSAVSPIALSLLHDTISPTRTCASMMVNRLYRAACTR